jgi:hypothetical protein
MCPLSTSPSPTFPISGATVSGPWRRGSEVLHGLVGASLLPRARRPGRGPSWRPLPPSWQAEIETVAVRLVQVSLTREGWGPP